MKYIYKVEKVKCGLFFGFDSGKQKKQLDKAGADGWKLICISEGRRYLKYVYIKKIDD